MLRPIADSLEMGLEIEAAAARLRADTAYGDSFERAFGASASVEHLASALAAYVRTIFSGNSRFDRFVDGDTTALTAVEREGLRLFRGKAGCVRCHVGPNLTDEQFHNTGVAWRDGQLLDVGRYAVTGRRAALGAFKTPTLREVARTSPYMHDGSLSSLEEVIEFYDGGGRPNPYLDAGIHSLGLDAAERRALTAFLRTLAGDGTSSIGRDNGS